MAGKPSAQAGLNQAPPDRIADDLARYYGRMNATALRMIRQLLIPAIESGDQATVERVLRQIDEVLSAEYSDQKIRERAEKAAGQADNQHRLLFFAGLAAAARVQVVGTDDPASRTITSMARPRVIGTQGPVLVAKLNVNPTMTIDQFVDANVRYVSTLRNGIVQALGDQVAAASVLGGEVTGQRPARIEQPELAARLLDQWRQQGVPSKIPTRRIKRDGSPVFVHVENHAALIARDQIATLNGQLNEARQKAAGITQFVWETQKDPRVRDSHAALQGKRFSWTEGAPGVGYPGQPINCRCWARAVVDRDQVIGTGDWISAEDIAPGRFTERNRPGVRQIAPGPGASLAFSPGPFD